MIEEILAVKLQVSKECWKDELESTRQEIDHVKEMLEHYENKSKELDEKLKQFIKKYREQLTTHAHEVNTPKSVLKLSAGDSDFVEQLAMKLNYVMNCAKRVIEDRDLLWNERDNCLSELGFSERGKTISDVVKSKVKVLNDEIDKLENTVDDNQGIMRHQIKRMDSLEIMIEQRDKRIELLEDKVLKLQEIQAEQLVTIEHLEKEKSDLIETNALLKEKMVPGSPKLRAKSARLDRAPGSPILGGRSSPNLRINIPGSPVLGQKTPSSPNLRSRALDSDQPKTASSPNLRPKTPGSPSINRTRNSASPSPRSSSPRAPKFR